MRRLRALHAVTAGGSTWRAVTRGWADVPGMHACSWMSPTSATRHRDHAIVLRHTGHEFSLGSGFDVNPVMWKVLAERGIVVRGPAPETLGLQRQPELLRSGTGTTSTPTGGPGPSGSSAGRVGCSRPR